MAGMILLNAGSCPKFTVDKVSMPFMGPDVGQVFNFSGKVKLDAINPEGPTYVFEVLAMNFPGRSPQGGTMAARRKSRNIKARPPRKRKR